MNQVNIQVNLRIQENQVNIQVNQVNIQVKQVNIQVNKDVNLMISLT